MIRWLSIAVMTYMILGILWWGLLLYQKNQEYYQVKLELVNTEEQRAATLSKMERQEKMILGEGIVLILSLLTGIYIINRSANQEIKNIKQQSDFILSVSHELKSPIAAIRLALQTLTRKGLPPEKQEKFINSAVKDSKRLESLVQNILVSASISNSKLTLHQERLDLIDICRKLTAQMKINGDQLHVSAHHLWVKCDRLFIEQAITNLLDNALKYALEGSNIALHLGVKNNYAQCQVINYGPEISAAERKLIFDKFYRGKSREVRAREGTGIGLYIAHQIALLHDGDILVDSADGRNTFTLQLPLNVA